VSRPVPPVLPAPEPPAADVAAGGGGLLLSRPEFSWFQQRVYREVGIHFKDAKRTMLSARLARRLRALGLADFATYRDHLEHHDPNGAEFAEMVNAVTTNKTEFFREAHHFEFLRSELIPRVRERAGSTGRRRLRIWSSACSTGEEPYSIAMTLREHLGPLQGWDVKILASDIDTRVLATASEGVYQEDKLEALPDGLRARYFQRGKNGSMGLWRARPELRELIDFRRINLNEGTWPLGERFDAIFCRNVIIYFDRPTQIRLFERFAERLEPDGFLFLGHSESLIGVSERFELVRQTVHRFRRDAGAVTPAPPAVVSVRPPPRAPPAFTPTPAPVAARLPLKRIIVGEVFASRQPVLIRTLLGSCVSASLYDPEARIGGLNHFLLPDGHEPGAGARYGVHAMELLINRIMNLGGARERLVAKVFGGAHVLPGMSRVVPEENVEFVRAFLAKEGIPLIGERLSGSSALEVCFEATSGRALVRSVSAAPAILRAQLEAERVRLAREAENAAARVYLF
jgi:chemotaxis protein methyltransferase CheR